MSCPSSRLHWYSFISRFLSLVAVASPLLFQQSLPTAEAFAAPQAQRGSVSPSTKSSRDVLSAGYSSSHESRLQGLLEPSVFESLSAGYTYCSEHYYIQTQSVTGAVCAALGDAIAQRSEQKESVSLETTPDYDLVRTFHYFLKGLGGGIAWAYWFELAEPLSNVLTFSVVGEEAPFFAEQATRTIISISLEQFLMSPFIFTFWDIPLPALLRGSPLRQIPAQVESKLVPLLVANSKVWTFANLITYNIPMDYRVLFSSLTDIIWQSINASITSQEIDSTAGVPPVVVGMEEEAPEPSPMSRRPVSARAKSAVGALGVLSRAKS